MVKTSGLPLILSRGKFMSLEAMSVPQLENFVSFMTKCSIQRANATLKDNVPVWWRSTINFRFPLVKPRVLSDIGYKRHLINIVYRCYLYHDLRHILLLSSEVCILLVYQLMARKNTDREEGKPQLLLLLLGDSTNIGRIQIAKNPDSVVMIDNGNNSTSLIYAQTKQHILTFSNENINYDSQSLQNLSKSPRKCLLPQPQPNRQATKIADIYLCENCDAELSSQRAMLAHERQCYGPIRSQPASPDPVDLLTYLNLGQHVATQAPPASDSSSSTLNLTLMKNKDVEFSSLLGQKILKSNYKKDAVNRPEKLISIYDVYCNTSLTARKPREHSFQRSLRRRTTLNQEPSWHTYSFTRRERFERYDALRHGLNRESRLLLRKCKKLNIKLDRLPPRPHSPELIILDEPSEPEPVTRTATANKTETMPFSEENNVGSVVASNDCQVLLTKLPLLSEAKMGKACIRAPGGATITRRKATPLGIASENSIYVMEKPQSLRRAPGGAAISIRRPPPLSSPRGSTGASKVVDIVNLCSSDEE